MEKAPNPKPLAATKRSGPAPKRRGPNPGDMLGYGLLALGGAGLIALGVMTYTRSTPPIAPGAPSAEKSSAAIQSPQSAAPVSLASLTGEWVVREGASMASLVFAGSVYQLLFVADEKGEIRRFSRGRFRYDEATRRLTLTPDGTLGEPTAIPGVIHKIMTVEPFEIVLDRGPDRTPGPLREIIWRAPADKIATRQIHPLFHYMMKSEQPEILLRRTEHKQQASQNAGAARSRNR